jgi:hypothetical protein
MYSKKQRKRGNRKQNEQAASLRTIDGPAWNIPTGEIMRAGGKNGSRAGVYKTILQSTYGATVLTGNAVSPQFFAQTVQLNNMANFAAYAALFDSYRITVAEWRFVMAHPGLNTQYPRLAYFADFDDSSAPASDVAVYSHPKVKYHTFTPTNNEFAVSVAPKCAISTYQAGAFSGYSQPNVPVWIDCNNPGVAHFGLKGSVDNFTDSTVDIQVSVKIWIEFRDPL